MTEILKKRSKFSVKVKSLSELKEAMNVYKTLGDKEIKTLPKEIKMVAKNEKEFIN